MFVADEAELVLPPLPPPPLPQDPNVKLRRTTIDRATCVLLPERDARRLCAVPVSRTGRQIDVAIANPTNKVVVRELVETLCAPVRLLLASRSEIEATIDHFHSPAITRP